MDTSAVERRIRRRSLHRSRSGALAVTLGVVALVAAWIGTEAALAAVGHGALVVAPTDLVRALTGPDPTQVPIVGAVAGALVVAGIVLVVLAVAPGRRHRAPVAVDRGAAIVDAGLVATTAARTAARAAGLPPGHVRATVSGRRTRVHVVPSTGSPVDRDQVTAAVRDRLGRIDPRLSDRVAVVVAASGTLS